MGKSKAWRGGVYEAFIVEKGVNETMLPLKKGECYYTVFLGGDDYLDVATQAEAEIISRLVRIEHSVVRMENMLKKSKLKLGKQ